jgi:predicted enzyme related to lactoylglutathione lyase
MAKVTGIGGIFFACKNPKEIKDWYSKNLGLETDEYGTTFEWRKADNPANKGFTQWSPMKDNDEYLQPSRNNFIINYRVKNIESLVDDLRNNGVRILDEIESFEYGKFVHILDPEGNKIELWQPNDEEFDKILNVRMK